MTSQHAIRDARLASQVYRESMRRLTAAMALETDAFEHAATEYVAHLNYQRAMRELNLKD